MTTNPPLFSIITITKDNLRGLKSTHQSLNQSCADYEWIIIDGDSADGTKTYLEGIISEPDKGIYDAMNKGMARAKGDYIIFMNAGDRFSDPDILASISKAIAFEKPDFIYGDALESSGFYKKARSHDKIAYGLFTHHQAMIYKRVLIGNLKYDLTYKIAADYDFTARFLKSAKNIHYIPAAICIFEEGGISQTSRKTGRKEQFTIRRKLNICGELKNRWIYVFQTLSAALKQNAPRLYARLR